MSTTSKATTSASPPVVITSFPVVPLTTTFKPPADCSGFYAPSDVVYMVDPMTSCLPSGFNVAPTSYFSPGIICPSGYISACHDTEGVSTITTVTCCPVRGQVSLSCVHTSSLAGVFSTLFCSWIPPSTTSILVTLSSNGGTTSTSLVTFAPPAGFNAYGIRMVYESSDLAALPTSSTPQTNSASTTPSTSSTTSPTTSAAASPTGSASKTSGGTIAAAVVVPLLVLALLGGFYFWWRRQRKRKPQSTSLELSSAPPKWYSASSELPPTEVKRSEMSDSREPVELPATRE